MRTKPHKEEMIRFAKSEYGTAVWFRPKTSTTWSTLLKPTWNENYIYVVADEYAELIKKSIDENRAIQMYNTISSKWETPTFELDFSAHIESYRLEPKENHDYIEPIAYYRWERLSSKGKILVSDLISDKYAEKNGYKEDGWIKITNTKRTWEY